MNDSLEFDRGFKAGLNRSSELIQNLLEIYMLGSELPMEEKLRNFPNFVKEVLPIIIGKIS